MVANYKNPKMRPTILITNDDSIYSTGIRLLIEIAQKFGDVVVVAPDSAQSAKGHSVTIGEPLRLKPKHSMFEGVKEAYACTGTPADCVKLGMDKVLEKKPDFCFSGINHGSNASVNVVYSGTMGAAMEAALAGVPSIGFSNQDYDHQGDLTTCAKYVEEIIETAMTKGFGNSSLLNVNVPFVPVDKVKGIRICRQAVAQWTQEFDERADPYGRSYYWLTGNLENNDIGEDTDLYALEHHYVSVVPVLLDFTAHQEMELLNQKWNNHG